MIGIVQRWNHARANHFDGLDEIVADEIIAGQAQAGDDEALKDLPKQREARAPGSGHGASHRLFTRERLRF